MSKNKDEIRHMIKNLYIKSVVPLYAPDFGYFLRKK